MESRIEKQVVEAFFTPSRRARYLEGLASRKKRAKILDRLNHFVEDFDARYIVRVPPKKQSAHDIEVALFDRGAPGDCYVMSSWEEIDGKTMALSGALETVVGSGMGTVISCIHGRLAYYEAEESGERFILERIQHRAS